MSKKRDPLQREAVDKSTGEGCLLSLSVVPIAVSLLLVGTGAAKKIRGGKR